MLHTQRKKGNSCTKEEKGVSMEDSFGVRVDKAFGSLGNTTPSINVTASLWCLTDEEIEKREWNRNKGEEEEIESGPSIVRPEIDPDLDDLSDGEEEEESEEIDGKKRRRQDHCAETIADEHWDVRANIGLDCTLDYEEEEDEFDKVAVGMEDTGDRLYMKDLHYVDYGVEELDTTIELPNSFEVVEKDPRANHSAARIRLVEDSEAAGNFDTLQLSENSTNVETQELNPKSILKKREDLVDSRSSQKRVRFDPKINTQKHEDKQQPSGDGDSTSISIVSSGIPDYLRNPSKYTKYAFDYTDDMNEETNRKAYMDLFQYLKKTDTGGSSSPLDESSADISKPVVFTPKKKAVEELTVKSNIKNDVNSKGWSVSITAEDTQESEVSAMEEDEPSVSGGGSLQKPGRRYRARTEGSVDDNLS